MSQNETPKYNPQVLQHKYEQWRELYQQQIEAQKRWLEAEALLDDLQAYYQSPQWIEDYEGDLDFDYSGTAHSILSEDTLWNALTDRDDLAMRWMRLGLDAIDKN